MEVEGSEAKWARAVRIVWEAGIAVRSLWSNTTPQAGVLEYLIKVFLAGAFDRDLPKYWEPPPEV